MKKNHECMGYEAFFSKILWCFSGRLVSLTFLLMRGYILTN